jgi:hypothetical protein
LSRPATRVDVGIVRDHAHWLKSSTRHYADGDFTTTITGYDGRGRATGKSVTVPAALTGQTTYAFGYGYDVADHQTTVDLPAVGSVLAAETVTAGYNDLGYPVSLTGASTYLSWTLYTGEARVDTRLIGTAPNQVTRKYTYTDVAKRLTWITTTNPASSPTTVENDAFSYDAEGNVVSVYDGVAAQRECFTYDGLNRLVDAYTRETSALATVRRTRTTRPRRRTGGCTPTTRSATC